MMESQDPFVEKHKSYTPYVVQDGVYSPRMVDGQPHSVTSDDVKDIYKLSTRITARTTPSINFDFKDITEGNTTRIKQGDFGSLDKTNRPQIRLNNDLDAKNKKYIFAHELDHAVQRSYPFLSNPTKTFQHNLKFGVESDPYLDKKNEIRSRIMEARMFFNLSPEKRDYNPSEGIQMLEQLRNSNIPSLQQLDRLTPETFVNYLNFMANNTNNQNSINDSTSRSNMAYAKHGGTIYGFTLKIK